MWKVRNGLEMATKKPPNGSGSGCFDWKVWEEVGDKYRAVGLTCLAQLFKHEANYAESYVCSSTTHDANI